MNHSRFFSCAKVLCTSAVLFLNGGIFAQNTDGYHISNIQKNNPTTVEVKFSNNQSMFVDFYGDNIFRIFQDNSGKGMRAPEAKPEAQILVDNPRKKVSEIITQQGNDEVKVQSGKISIIFNKNGRSFKVFNANETQAVINVENIEFGKNKTTLTLTENQDEYFYGGGVQNGRFSHKGKMIAIENQNSWTDGGVASPNPFYWSTKGYGMMWYTFKSGNYDFGAKQKGKVFLSHNTDYLDVFFSVSKTSVGLLNDFYQLTGNPVLLPKFGYYQGHLNAYNRDFWKEDPKGIPFEDGKRYKESQKDNGGIQESLNGEKNNYQFSARAVIDRYKKHDMPLGWVLPNDGYGAGYGQEETFDGNIQNLKKFGDYARKNGVEIGLWTQSDLHPKEGISPLLQRDIVKEVRDAGVNVLKTDVAWVGAGYSFGLNGVADVADVMVKYGNNIRPFIISLDGWAGTQRFAGIWSGDQTGGEWEYIRFHIPTYIGSGLSGNPNISSDMDGIFGGKNAAVNIRDFQWKTFTLMQLNMDGWGSNEKYPHALGEPATSINRNYLKLKSEILPYAYTLSRVAVDGMPTMRPMFMEETNDYTLGIDTQYQFMLGGDFLVAPIYKETKADKEGNDIRHNIYLPKGVWIDYFTGETYEGGRVINHFSAPIWKLPVFVKAGAIIPMHNPNNNISEIKKDLRIFDVYPAGKTSFTLYDDDGTTQEYLAGKYTNTLIESEVKKSDAVITIHKTKGDFKGFVKQQATEFRVNLTEKPKQVALKIGGKKQKLQEVKSLAEFQARENVFFYNEKPDFNRFATKGTAFENQKMIKNPQLWVKSAKADITSQEVVLEVKGFKYEVKNHLLKNTGSIVPVKDAKVSAADATPYTLKPTWLPQENADYYEIEFDNILYSNILSNELEFENLKPETNYDFKIRAVNEAGKTEWVTFRAATKADPYRFTIKGATATTSVKNQGGSGVQNLFDGDEASGWHTDWSLNAIPFTMEIDLKTVNTLEKMEYVPRKVGANGILMKGKISVSTDKINWKDMGEFSWTPNNANKIFEFKNNPSVRFIKIDVSEAVGNFGSGQEMYIYKVPNTESYLQGDINNDKKVDSNDLVSYTNYTGLRKGDSDFEGYVSIGDINQNDLIDAYDIAVAVAQMNENQSSKEPVVEGKISIQMDKNQYAKGDTITILVKGSDLKSVNALSFAIPYEQKDLDFVGIEPIAVSKMDNFSKDRLHTFGEKSLYPTFVNVENTQSINGTTDLMKIKFKAKKDLKPNFKLKDVILVDKNLNVK